MKAIILAAGYGTRLGNITRNLPKPMIDIGGKPVIEHILTRLAEYEITEIMVNVHYLSEIITDYLKNRVMYYHEPVLLEPFIDDGEQPRAGVQIHHPPGRPSTVAPPRRGTCKMGCP